MPGWRTINVRTSETSLDSRCALCEAIELAGPHFGFFVVVNDVVVWFEATVMKILVLVDARIVVVGEVWSQIVQNSTTVRAKWAATYCFPQHQFQNLSRSCGSI